MRAHDKSATSNRIGLQDISFAPDQTLKMNVPLESALPAPTKKSAPRGALSSSIAYAIISGIRRYAALR
ncbi:hypothetical protein ACVV7K_002820, partial [Cronobacter sakazakii]